jgi:transcriptional antiterminator NusG
MSETIEEKLQLRLKDNFEWYVLKTYGPEGIEEKVKECIIAEVENTKLDEDVGRIVIQEEDIFEIKRGKKVTRTRKKYQGYIFIEMEPSQELCRIILSQNFVSGFVGGEKNNPLCIEDHEAMKILEDHFKQVAPKPKLNFDLGEDVKINNGPFQGTEGVVKSIDGEKGKLVVNVNIFGRVTPVDLEAWQVAKAE